MFFNSSSPLGDCRERNSLSPRVTSEECPCTCIPLPPAPTPRVKVHCEPAPRSCGRDDAGAAGSLPACCEMIQMLNPACPGRAGAGQCRGAVAGLGAPGSFSACRPQWDLSSLIERQAPELARAVCSPQLQRAEDVYRAAGWLRCRPGSCCAGCGRSVRPLRSCRGDGLWCGTAPAAHP